MWDWKCEGHSHIKLTTFDPETRVLILIALLPILKSCPSVKTLQMVICKYWKIWKSKFKVCKPFQSVQSESIDSPSKILDGLFWESHFIYPALSFYNILSTPALYINYSESTYSLKPSLCPPWHRWATTVVHLLLIPTIRIFDTWSKIIKSSIITTPMF